MAERNGLKGRLSLSFGGSNKRGAASREEDPMPGKQGKAGKKSNTDVFGILGSLSRLARSRWQVVVIIGLGLTAAGNFLLLGPASSSLKSLKEREGAAETAAAQLQAQIEDLQSEAGAAAASARYDRALFYERSLSVSLSQLEVLAQISALAERSGVSVRELSPIREIESLNPTTNPNLGFYAFQIYAAGSFEQIADFFDLIEASEPLATVYSFRISNVVDRDGNVTLGFAAEIRVWASSSPALSSFRQDQVANGDGQSAPVAPGTETTVTTAPPTLAPAPETTTTAPPVAPPAPEATTTVPPVVPPAPPAGSPSPESSTVAPPA